MAAKASDAADSPERQTKKYFCWAVTFFPLTANTCMNTTITTPEDIDMHHSFITAFASALLLINSQIVQAESSIYKYNSYKRIYEVSITNITKGQTFTPQLVTTHVRNLSLFSLGEPASDALAKLAESGDTSDLMTSLLDKGPQVSDVQTVSGLLEPGQTVTVDVQASQRTRFLSVAAMLIPTNDTFVGGDKLRMPRWGQATYYLQAYDAGTEFNDQNCVNIPGPRCNGEANSEPLASDEGFVHVSNGFHDLGIDDGSGNEVLQPFTYDWRNPVAKVVVKRVH